MRCVQRSVPKRATGGNRINIAYLLKASAALEGDGKRVFIYGTYRQRCLLRPGVALVHTIAVGGHNAVHSCHGRTILGGCCN